MSISSPASRTLTALRSAEFLHFLSEVNSRPHLSLPPATAAVAAAAAGGRPLLGPVHPSLLMHPRLPASPVTPPPREARVACGECEGVFDSGERLARHRASRHARAPKKSFRCDICRKTFGKKNHVARHIKAVHYNVRPFVCTVCGFPFQEKRGLARHLKVHEKGGKGGRKVPASLGRGIKKRQALAASPAPFVGHTLCASPQMQMPYSVHEVTRPC